MQVSLEEHKRRERAQAVALFRYQLICPALEAGLSTKQRGRLVREIADRSHTDPFGGQVRYLAGHAGPLDPPLPRRRVRGAGARRRGGRRPAPTRRCWSWRPSLKRENPARTAAQVARILRTSTGWAPSESTLLRHFHRLELMGPAAGRAPVVFGRFEAADPNELWVGDALHGPRVGGRKTYLFAFLDDHCPAGGRATGSGSPRTPCAWPPRWNRRWPPAASPAGSTSTTARAFVDAWLLRACAKLGIRLVHSTPTARRAAARSSGSSAPCASSSSSRSPTPPAEDLAAPGSITGGGAAGAQPAVHRVGRDRLPPPDPLRDRADPAGPVGGRLGPAGPDPGDAHRRRI